MLVEFINNKEFLLDYQFGFDFCRVVNECNSKNDYIYLSCNGKIFSLFIQTPIAAVIGSVEVQNNSNFHVGVESSKFIALFKKLYAGSSIKFQLKGNKLHIIEDNILIKFPVSDYVKDARFPQLGYVEGPEVVWLIEHLNKCSNAIGKSDRFPGILIDNTGSVGRISRFSTTSIRICAYPSFSFGKYRFVVPPQVISALHIFRNSVTRLLLGEGKFGAVLQNGIMFYVPMLSDEYPSMYTEHLGLLDDVTQINKVGRKYVFSRQRLLEVLDLVSTVVGTEESLLLCDIVGLVEGTDFPVWRMSATTYVGCEASESLKCQISAPTDMPAFRIHKNRAIDAIRCHQEEVVIYDSDDRFLIITDETCSDVTLLSKVPV